MCFVPGTEQSVGCNGGDVAHILAVIHLHQTIIVFVCFLSFFYVFGAQCGYNDELWLKY